MKKRYDGLEAYKICIDNGSFIYTSGNCKPMIQLQMVDGVCKSPEWQQQIEYVGENG